MKLKLELNVKKIEEKINLDMNGMTYKIAESINGDVVRAGVIPFDRGDLQNTSFVKRVDEKTSEIQYNQPYAVKMWYGEGFNFQKSHNANATHHWALPYMTSTKIKLYAAAFLKKKGY